VGVAVATPPLGETLPEAVVEGVAVRLPEGVAVALRVGRLDG
jgi:hypothetical protein